MADITKRPDYWQTCLGVKDKETQLVEFYDLDEQSLIHSDCVKLAQLIRIDNEAEQLAISSDIESVVTTFAKCNQLKYTTDNGWLDILTPLLDLHMSTQEVYNCFAKIVKTYIPHYFATHLDDYVGREGAQQPYHLLRLLLLYHDPELLSFLDTKKITPDLYAASWFRSIFAAHCDIKVTQSLWDVYFQKADPFLAFYLGLVLLINSKDDIMELKESSKENLVDFINKIPDRLDIEDVSDLFYIIENHYQTLTPSSIKEFHPLIFTATRQEQIVLRNLAHALCLPVPVWDLLPAAKTGVRYFVVDCRPPEQYNNGHLSTAFHLDHSLMFSDDRDAFKIAVEGLRAVQEQAIEANSVAAGRHLCFMGSGREEEDQYVHMVVSWFLKTNNQYVSLAEGGYQALHEMLIKNDSEKLLADHNKKKCLVCNVTSNHHANSVHFASNGHEKKPSSASPFTNILSANSSASGSASNSDAESTSSSLFDKMSNMVKSKSMEMKGKLETYINSSYEKETRHVSSTDKLGKRYTPSGKSLDLLDDDGLGEETEELNVEQWAKDQRAIGVWRCQSVKDDGIMVPSYMVLTATHIYILKELAHNKGWARIVAKRPLQMIVQITSKRRCPDLITFKYGQESEASGEPPVVMATDLLLIPKPYDVTRLVKQQVIRVLESET